MYFAKPFLLPLFVAALLSFALGPLVWLLGRLRFPRVVAVLVSVFVAGGAVSVVSYFVVNELVQFTAKVPDYAENIRRKLEGFRGGGVIARASLGIGKLKELISPEAHPATAAESTESRERLGPLKEPRPVPAGRDAAAVPVRVVQETTGLHILREYFGPLVEPLATAGVVMLLVIFLLIYKDDLRDRCIRIIAGRRLATTTQAIEDASLRITRYLISNLAVNGAYVVPICVGLYALGVPNALLWGMVAGLLRFIPYVGPPMGAAMPVLLAFAVHDGWLEVALVAALFVCTELLVANVLEPWLYGKKSGLSPVGVIVASFFWAWLWGIPGLLLAIPVTLSLAVAGRYVQSLRFLTILFGEERGLTNEERFYQRLIARDTVAAGEVADAVLKTQALEDLFADIVLPALGRADQDARADVLDADAVAAVEKEARELSEEQATLQAARDTAAGRVSSPPAGEVVYLAAAGGLDALAGELVAIVLERAGVRVLQVGGASFAAEVVEILRQRPNAVVCVGALSASSSRRMRYLSMRLRASTPGSRIVAALWGARPNSAEARAALESIGADRVALGLREGIAALQALVSTGLSQGPRRPEGPSLLSQPSAAV
jgi:predicted PurR-regulated permease PerM/methanogenic corrinoid protein MtbC1